MISFDDYRRHDALGLAAGVRRGDFTAEELLATAVARADAVNDRLGAIVRWCVDDARARARQAPAGAFTGVPFLVKDMLQDIAGQPTTQGSRALPAQAAEIDSLYVSRAHAAGLNTFGQTNTPELGLKAITEPLAFGPARNPWHMEHSPGGSSGGAAAAVAAGIVPMAGGNDGGGSLRIPAAWCGLFGLKPSRGRVSAGPRHGEVWEGAAVDHVITRSVRDSAAMLDILAVADPGAPYCIPPPRRSYREETEHDPGRLRIALDTRSPLGRDVDPECVEAAVRTAHLLEELGHHVEPAAPTVDGLELARCYFMLYYGQVAATVAGGEESRFEAETRLLARIGHTVSAGEYAAARRQWHSFARCLDRFLEHHDLYLTPTTAVTPPRIGALDLPRWQHCLLRLGLHLPGRSLPAGERMTRRLALDALAPTPFTQLANLAGRPAMSVPLYWTPAGLPLGSHLTAPFGREDRLFRLAAQLERAAPWFARTPEL